MSDDERILFVDGRAGASGDMILGALVDLGVPASVIRRALESLALPDWRIVSRRVARAGLTARRVSVRVEGEEGPRRWAEIRRIIRRGGLEAGVREKALEVFRRLFEAEARVHGSQAEKIHLHEVGGTDAIVDVVGACVGFEHLRPAKIVVSTLTTGGGTVHCAHGVYSVPAPATAVLIQGVPVQEGDIQVERLTPTGAAILTTLANAWGPLPPMRPLAVGYGAGSRDLGGAPNLLRMILGAPVVPIREDRTDDRELLVIEFNVDDAPPQVLAYAAERLLQSGALEVFTTAVQMKKGRTGHLINVLARPEDLGVLSEVCFHETTTLGLRYRPETRLELERSFERVRTPYGSVRIKVGRLQGRSIQAWPEFEDCARLARDHGVPLREIQQSALQAHRNHGRPAARRHKESS